MKLRASSILSAIAVTAATAVTLAVTTTACLRGMVPKTNENDIAVVVGDLNAYSSASRLQRCRYERYADRASADGNRTAAGLFTALARSEHIHENACARAAGLLKAQCRTVDAAAFAITDTKGNLRRSIEEERARHETQGEAVAHAIEAKSYYTARILIWIDGTNRRHIELLEKCLLAAENQQPCDGCEYDVCPMCGNVYEADNRDAYCPLCRTHNSEFESFGRLQSYQTVADGIHD